jgi:hypothetical protein
VITVVLLQDESKDGSTFDGISTFTNAKAQYGASSSGSRGNLYPDSDLPGTVLRPSVLYFQTPYRQSLNTLWMNSFIKFCKFGFL